MDEDRAENMGPKEKPAALLNSVVDEILAMQIFFKYLVSMDGGCSPMEASQENVRRVGRLLYQVQGVPRDVQLLWDDAALNIVRKRFFEDNHLLEKPRTAATLRAYITALRVFYDFVPAKYCLLNQSGRKIYKSDQDKVKSSSILLDGWLKTLAPAIHVRRAEIRKKAHEELLSTEDLKKIVNSQQSKNITNEMLKLENKTISAISCDQFAKFCDNLLLRMHCKTTIVYHPDVIPQNISK